MGSGGAEDRITKLGRMAFVLGGALLIGGSVIRAWVMTDGSTPAMVLSWVALAASIAWALYLTGRRAGGGDGVWAPGANSRLNHSPTDDGCAGEHLDPQTTGSDRVDSAVGAEVVTASRRGGSRHGIDAGVAAQGRKSIDVHDVERSDVETSGLLRLALANLGAVVAVGTAVVMLTSGLLSGIWFGLAAVAVVGLVGCAARAPQATPTGQTVRLPGRWILAVWAAGAMSIVFALRTAGGRGVLIPVAVCAVVIAVEWFRPATLDRVVRVMAATVGRVVSTLLFFVLGLVTLVFAFGGPLKTPDRWAEAERTATTERSWSTSGRNRWRDRPLRGRLVRAFLLAALLCGSTAYIVNRRGEDATVNRGLSLSDVAARNSGRGGTWWDEPDTTPAAYEGQDWYDGYKADSEWVMNQAIAFRPLHAYRVGDVSTRTINVRNGVRSTWKAPACSCRRISVWMYGGSTTFGIGQRDDFTIPSMLAKAAWAKGIALDVVNRGMPGDLHWQEANRLAWDLANGAPPDLVVFYDGVNEVWGTGTRRSSADPDVFEPIAPMTDQFWVEVLKAYDSEPPPTPDGASVPTTAQRPSLSAVEVGALAVDRYRRSLSMSRDIVAARDLPSVWFWQPSRLSRAPVDGEPNDGDLEDDARQITKAAEAAIPEGVVDLTGAFDDVDQPLFSDDVHHNEVGAEVIADRMFAEIRPILTKIEPNLDTKPTLDTTPNLDTKPA